MFKNRNQAGKLLAKELKNISLDRDNTVVIALPRGGVPVAYQVAKELNLPLDIFCVKKIGYPSNPELAMGAVTEDGETYINQSLKFSSGLSNDTIESLRIRTYEKAKEQTMRLRGNRAAMNIQGKSILLIDDGIATGATVEAAIKLLHQKGAKEIILAVPVASKQASRKLSPAVDKFIALDIPERFHAVGQWYQEFQQVDDQEVIEILQQRRQDSPLLESSSSEITSKMTIEDITISYGSNQLHGRVRLVPAAKAWIVFAHGSGSSHLSTRNNWVAQQLNEAGFSTLLFDLLTPQEDLNYRKRFNIGMLAERLSFTVNWLIKSSYYLPNTPIGLFGASTGAAAALVCAAEEQDRLPLYTIVSRGGRPDLAGSKNLAAVSMPTLLLVGDNDFEVIELNRNALKKLSEGYMELIPGATHLFEEPGTLADVANRTCMWFDEQLVYQAPIKQEGPKSVKNLI